MIKRKTSSFALRMLGSSAASSNSRSKQGESSEKAKMEFARHRRTSKSGPSDLTWCLKSVHAK